MTNADQIRDSLAARLAFKASDSTWQFILYGGLGDHIMWLSLLVAFRQRATAPVIVYCDPRTADLARLYTDRAFDTLVEVDSLTLDEVISLQGQAQFAPGKPLVAWHPFFIGEETRFLAGRDLSMTDVIRQILQLPTDTPMHPPDVMENHRLAAQLDLLRLRLPPGRTVLLAPWAKSAQVTLPDAWWAELAGTLASQGYTVVTNTNMRSRGFDRLRVTDTLAALPGTFGVDIPLRHIIPFAELCGTVVTARSGLSDVLAFSKARHWVVCPYAVDREAYFYKLFRIYSLRRLYPCHDLTEVHQEGSAPFDPGPLLEWLRASPHARPPR